MDGVLQLKAGVCKWSKEVRHIFLIRTEELSIGHTSCAVMNWPGASTKICLIADSPRLPTSFSPEFQEHHWVTLSLIPNETPFLLEAQVSYCPNVSFIITLLYSCSVQNPKKPK